MDYETLLKKAKKEMPEIVHEKERFEIPNVKGHIQGVKTVISNIGAIASHLHRPIEHMTKYLLKELAAPGDVKNGSLYLGRKISASEVNAKIKQYTDEYVFCKSCGKPDTELVKESNAMFMQCMVCGNKTPVRAKV